MTDTWSPGWYFPIALNRSSPPFIMLVSPTLVMISFTCKPAFAAGLSLLTVVILAPLSSLVEITPKNALLGSVSGPFNNKVIGPRNPIFPPPGVEKSMSKSLMFSTGFPLMVILSPSMIMVIFSLASPFFRMMIFSFFSFFGGGGGVGASWLLATVVSVNPNRRQPVLSLVSI